MIFCFPCRCFSNKRPFLLWAFFLSLFPGSGLRLYSLQRWLSAESPAFWTGYIWRPSPGYDQSVSFRCCWLCRYKNFRPNNSRYIRPIPVVGLRFLLSYVYGYIIREKISPLKTAFSNSLTNPPTRVINLKL